MISAKYGDARSVGGREREREGEREERKTLLQSRILRFLQNLFDPSSNVSPGNKRD